MQVGDVRNLSFSVSPSNASYDNVIWSSSNTSVATVEDGRVEALKEGVAIIKVTIGNKSASCGVTVSAKEQGGQEGQEKDDYVKATSISLDKHSVDILKGESETLKATVKPSNASGTVEWKSFKKEIATVSDGVVTGIKKGTTYVIVTLDDCADTCEVNILDEIEVTSIQISQTSLTVNKGCTDSLYVVISPSNATNQTVTWTSSDESIAKIDSNGIVTGISEGEATITAEVGKCKAICNVTVKIVAVYSISLGKSSLEIAEGASDTLTATIKPTDATDKTITWTSSDESVATVSDGVVKAVKEGTAIITAKAGEKSATCNVLVYSTDSYVVITTSKAGTKVTFRSGDDGIAKSKLTLAAGENKIYGAIYGFKITSKQSYVLSVDLTHWDASKVTDASNMFENCTHMTAGPDCSNMVNVTNAYQMFFHCSSMVTPPNCSGMSKLTNAYKMFYQCYAMTTPPDCSDMVSVTNAWDMFGFCSAMTTGPDCSNMVSVTNTSEMFIWCTAMTTGPNCSNMVNVVDADDMFWGCSAMTTPPDCTNMSVEHGWSVTGMFCQCSSLKEINTGKIVFTVAKGSTFEETGSLTKVTTLVSDSSHLEYLRKSIKEAKPKATIKQTTENGITVFTIKY